MSKDAKIKAAMQGIRESVEELRRMSKEEPERTMGEVTVRGWVFATQIHLEHLEMLLHDLQPSLF